ncbi:hypothetical protein BDQ12DRAFT_735330, partial [Crucibulum laeve]
MANKNESADVLHPSLDKVLNFRPMLLEQDPRSSPLIISPLSFYDKHVHESFWLKYVRPMPTLVSDLSLVVEESINSFKERGFSFPSELFPPPDDSYPTRMPMMDAHSVAQHYATYISRSCCEAAAKLIIHPQSAKWGQALFFTGIPNHFGERTWDDFVAHGYSLRVMRNEFPPHSLKIHPLFMDRLDEPTKEMLQSLMTTFPHLATWQMLAVSSEAAELLKGISFMKSAHFPWSKPGTGGYFVKPKEFPLSLDGDLAFLSTPHLNNQPGVDHKVISAATQLPEGRRTKSSKKGLESPKFEIDQRVIPPLRTGQRRGRSSKYRIDQSHFIQRAWVEAVNRDSTFIVFHSGQYERIAIRHRATQTLYVSDLVDIHGSENPAYGRLQVGLYAAVFRDALDRLPLVDKLQDIEPASSKKRLLNHDEFPKNVDKKRKTSTPSSKESNGPSRNENHPEICLNFTRSFFHEVCRRDYMLLTLNYGIYRSAAPSSFLRCGHALVQGEGPYSLIDPKRKPAYSLEQCLSLVLDTEIARGAVGIVHNATLSLSDAGGAVVSSKVAVKLAFSSEERDKLRHEFSIYCELSKDPGVKGVLHIFGLFQDMEDGTLALVMEHGGISVRGRELKAKNAYTAQVTISKTESELFVESLKSIHNAGVRHKDIRAENMVLKDSQVYFIDFDRAETRPTPKGLQRELHRLMNIIQGCYLESEMESMSSKS